MKEYHIQSRALRTGFTSKGTGLFSKSRAEEIVRQMNDRERQKPPSEQFEEWSVIEETNSR